MPRSPTAPTARVPDASYFTTSAFSPLSVRKPQYEPVAVTPFPNPSVVVEGAFAAT